MGTCVKKFQKTSLDDMKKYSNELFNKTTAYEDQLVDAYNNKKLKSENKIEEAKNIIAVRNSKKKKAQEKKEKIIHVREVI